MKRNSTLLAIATILALTGSLARAQTTANGPYYATPSWDQKLTTNRFVILANWNSEAVLDRETGLVWEQSPSTSGNNWLIQSFECERLSKGSRKGWRLPTIQELASLIDPTVLAPGPTLPAGHPFSNVLQKTYWSGSDRGGSGGASIVDFTDGRVGTDPKVEPYLAWCVRGPGVGP